jgi:protein-disulfide isomerase
MRPPFSALLGLLCAVACGASAPPAHTSNEAVVTSTPAATLPGIAGAPEDGAAVPVASGDPVWGDRRAPVTIVFFGDFQCPFTGKVEETVRSLEQHYGPSDLRVVWKDLPLPFHDHARAAAEAADAVLSIGQSDAYYRFWSLALQNQTNLTDASFEAWATASGVDVAAFRRAVQARAGAAKVDADMALAQRLGVVGTPTAFVNGIAIQGAQPYSAFTAIIDAELPQAKARLAAGVAADALYAERAKANWKPIAPDADEDEPKEDTTTVWTVPLGNSPVRGLAAAPVTLVVFSDFQCPFCKRLEPTLKKVVDTYGDKVRIVWKDAPLPFHPHAEPAAELAREARAEKGDAAFWKVHDALFESQPKLDDDDLIAIASQAGLDTTRVKSAIKAKKHAAAIDVDRDLGDDLEVMGTPQLFINGRRLVGAQPFERVQAMVDEEVAHASALVAKGTSPAALYVEIEKAAAPPPVPETKTITPRAKAPFKGPAGAKVVIEEFADFQCPYCSRADETLQKVFAAYPGKVKLVWRNYPLPFHAHATLAAEAAAEAQRQKGDTGFWAMHDKLYAHQGDDAGLDRAALEGYAKDLGLNVAAFKSALDGHTHMAEIDEDKRAADAAGIQGTPAFIIGGYSLSGAQPYPKFKRLIERVLADGPAKAR